MRVKGRALDRSQTYQSDWFGGEQDSVPTQLGCDGNPVVGMFGGGGLWIKGLGLVQVEPAPARGQPRRGKVDVQALTR
jgi:hypothetical protein